MHPHSLFSLWLTQTELVVGHGFADARKKHVVSKYHQVVAKEKKNLNAWSKKLKKIYAETESTADADPLERFSETKKKKKKKKRTNDVNVGHEQQTTSVKETVAAVIPSDAASSQRSEVNTGSTEPSAACDR